MHSNARQVLECRVCSDRYKQIDQPWCQIYTHTHEHTHTHACVHLTLHHCYVWEDAELHPVATPLPLHHMITVLPPVAASSRISLPSRAWVMVFYFVRVSRSSRLQTTHIHSTDPKTHQYIRGIHAEKAKGLVAMYMLYRGHLASAWLKCTVPGGTVMSPNKK